MTVAYEGFKFMLVALKGFSHKFRLLLLCYFVKKEATYYTIFFFVTIFCNMKKDENYIQFQIPSQFLVGTS
jgi:hypothetical protein